MKNRFMRILMMCLILFLVLAGTYKLMNARNFQLFGGLTSHVGTNQKVVAVTFDDGPTNKVDKLLPILERYHAKGTFFLIGNELQKNMAEGKKLAQAGHQLGNHTYSHKRMVFKAPSFIKQELKKTNALIRQTGYEGTIDFRPPNGKKLIGLPYYTNKLQMDTITWSLEPDTYYTSVSDKVRYVTKNVKPGSIILFHPMYGKTGNELESIDKTLSALSKKGYKFVTVNELQKYE
ncbi:polysaccharide deacetylase family protein [Fictibacillus sp. KIGAM418]|uniref:Polysaccharide deacetylase family protein n=1 Tax=Fictibacillus marinisediminis TaxID=2878389 RepID=A0A9X1XFI7_9BACL|nr:polysaccharide deacetylase family protein [Fictibacillus marinisediminis]MCK6258950.1 polysaccharide deacetylase family protein [Fictibacillus marinisediminis]